MATLKGSQTHNNLKRAFGLEAEANRRYIYFARQADVEGLLARRSLMAHRRYRVASDCLPPSLPPAG